MPGPWPRLLRRINGVCCASTRVDATATAATITTAATRRSRRLSLASSCAGGLRHLSSPALPRIPARTKSAAGSRHMAHSRRTAIVAPVRELSCMVLLQQQRQRDTMTSQPARRVNSSDNPSEQQGSRTRYLEKESAVMKAASATEATSDTEHVPPPPPPPQGPLSIVFTDIVKSTAIWEAHAAAMASAMQTHDDTVRSLITTNGGYEVKQNGDGFMIAFGSASSAVQFCLDVQEQLLDKAWPSAILKSTPGEETTDNEGHVLFRGLKLRMSAHWGEPVCVWNEVIQRMDYLGPMVNRAARFIEVTEGGQVVVSEDFLFRLQAELEEERDDRGDDHNESNSSAGENARQHLPEELDLRLLRSGREQKNLTHQPFRLRLLGAHEFKGLTELQKLYFIVPNSLEGRVEHWHQVTHVSGVKGNVRTAMTAATTATTTFKD